MNAFRLTRASEVLYEWPFFAEGLEHLKIVNKLYYHDLEAKKLICRLAADRNGGYVAVCYSDAGDPLAFGVMYEDTVPFAHFRTFSARAVYYRKDHPQAVVPLMNAFELWCRASNIKQYSYVSRRPTTAAKRCFMAPKFGFHKMALVFEKQLN